MKAMLIILAMVCANCFASASEPLASVESQDLGPVPEVIRSAIESDISFRPYGSLNCKMQGKKIPLSSDSSVSTWFVTTSQACGWGAALGPIWLVKKTSTGNPSLMLSTGGYSVAIAAKSRGGFVGIYIDFGTAEESVRKRYFFDGEKYVTSTN
ncbi:hypothetical protein [Paraburkholderia sp. EG304]|uniref:hypothetical protein n=1 Tax=Paraburkholderia sp. EG304 TaxID=3237015 RepID=UPI00397D6AD4